MQLSAIDRTVGHLDRAIRVVFGSSVAPDRTSPANAIVENEMSPSAREMSGRLMRVNHSGEVCAQALYQGQALMARDKSIQKALERSAREENDHLFWTAQRVRELGTHSSCLNFLWYSGSFAIGAAIALAGDRWSLGFLAETEQQVVEHLNRHCLRLPAEDAKSRAIIEQMSKDEARHATTAVQEGARDLPEFAKAVMRLTSKLMTGTSYWI